ncbi:MAG: ATP-dependent DNA helicase RecG, partial [Solirubrobacterales bacterium]
MADFSRVVGGGEVTSAQLAAAPIRWPRPSMLAAPLPVGPKTLEAAERLGIHDLGDLIEHVPVTHEFRAGRLLKQLKVGEEATIEVELRSISLRPTRRRNLRIVEAVVHDDSGSAKALWFNQQWLAKQLEPGIHLRLFGKMKGGAFQVREHAIIAASEGGADSGPISVYPGTEGLKSQKLRELVDEARGMELNVIDPLPGRFRARERLMSRADALSEMHFPSHQRASAAGRERLAFEELVLQQLALGMRRRRRVA